MNRSLLRQIGRRSPVLLFLALALISLPQAAAAQTADPKIVSFAPSTDQNTVLSDGTVLLQRYIFAVYQAGGTQPFYTLDIGKPGPGSDGLIHYDFSATVSSWPLPGGTYESRVWAQGPGGNGVSLASNQFTVTQSCSYALSATSGSFPAAGGAGQVNVTATSGCGWTAKSNVSWVTMNTTSGTSNGPVYYTVAANTTSSTRSGTLTIAGKTYTVSQQAAGCSYSLALYTQSVAAAGGTNSVAVTATSGCGWTATSNASWITITAGSSGSGNGTVTYSVAANATSTARTGTLTIAGVVFSVNQAAATTTAGGALPSPLGHMDIGASGTIAVAGTGYYNAGVFTVSGSGTNGIAASNDSFHYVAQHTYAQGTIIAHLSALTATSTNSRAAVMLRESTGGGARAVSAALLPDGRVQMILRSSPGAAATIVATRTMGTSVWLKIYKNGTSVTAYTSTDGVTWSALATVNSGFTSYGYLGLAVSSATTTLSTGTFDRMTIQ